jgi:hypothetical protein
MQNFVDKSIFMEGTEERSVIIDTNNARYIPGQLLGDYLREVYPEACGLKPRSLGKSQHIVEIDFSNDEDLNDALTKQLKIGVLIADVTRALSTNSQVFRIGISNIPIDRDDTIRENLLSIFEEYGDILKVGLSHLKMLGLP